MKKTQEKIQQLEKQILTEQANQEKELLITEMKRIGIEKLPYSYAALKQFINAETMDIHYNMHYKGYVKKLNDALSKKKYGDLDLEKIIKTIGRFDKTIRNNAGGAFNHALFWNMLTPTPKKLEGDLYKKITKQWGTFSGFKKEFEKIAKERFGSGWVWLVLTAKNTLKIMSTPNQDNPLMNVIQGGGFPLLGLDLWEHAYYLKYRNKRDEYIKNFWKVVNWDFVTKMYEMKTETKLNESVNLQNIITESTHVRFCDAQEVKAYKDLINDSKTKKIYQEGITNVLRKVFNKFWVEGNSKEMSGFYGVETREGRSVLNNLNTNFNTFCLLVRAVNKEITRINRPEKIFKFDDKEKRTAKEVNRFITALDFFSKEIFTKRNDDFINIIKVLKKLWDRGQKSEDDVYTKIEEYFKGNAKVTKIGGHGQKEDALKGIDLIVNLGGIPHTSQVKPFSSFLKTEEIIEMLDTGNVKHYSVDLLIFINPKTNNVMIFENKPISEKNQYVFKVESLLYEIK